LAAWVHQRTEGHPLFMVHVVKELARGGWEAAVAATAAAGQGAAAEVPADLQQLIELQLGQLDLEAQQVLEVASVGGVDFAEASVAAGLPLPLDAIVASCEGLARRGQFIEDRGLMTWPDGTVSGRYGFRHTLYQEILYRRIGSGRRMRCHRAIGMRLEEAYGAQVSQIAATLAVHFERGCDQRRAMRYRQQAADTALGRYAYEEAIGHLRRGLELLESLPNSAERQEQELDLQLALGPALIASKGGAAPEVEQAYARARELCQQVSEIPQRFSALLGLWYCHVNRGALPTAREFGEHLFRLAQRVAAPTLRLEGHQALGITSLFQGNYVAARTHCEQGIARIDPTARRAQALYPGPAPGVGCLTMAAHALWCLGYPAQALRRSDEALALAQALAHPYSLVYAKHFAAYLSHSRREISAVQAQADDVLALATAQGFPNWVAVATFWRGWGLVMQGQTGAGLPQMRQGMAGVAATGMMLGRPRFLIHLAEALGHTGQVEEGLRLLAEALAEFEAGGQGHLLAETYRLQGELLLCQTVPDVPRAEASFWQALTIARSQQAKSWELRAAMSLNSLWQQQGKRAEANELLAPIYGWFTEGFDTADLQEAKALLETFAG